MQARAHLVPRLVNALSAAREVLSAWMHEGQFDLELANVHAYALACKPAGDDHPAVLSGISVSRPPRDLVDVGRCQPRSLYSLPYQCPSLSFHAPCLSVSNRTHTCARARDVGVARGTAPPSRLCRPRLRPCRDRVAVLLALTIVSPLSNLAARSFPLVLFAIVHPSTLAHAYTSCGCTQGRAFWPSRPLFRSLTLLFAWRIPLFPPRRRAGWGLVSRPDARTGTRPSPRRASPVLDHDLLFTRQRSALSLSTFAAPSHRSSCSRLRGRPFRLGARAPCQAGARLCLVHTGERTGASTLRP
jgi:hypothetical protein